MKYTVNLPENYIKPVLPDGKKWCEQLRSGNFIQGDGYLCRDDKYCCLGVLSKTQNRLRDFDYNRYTKIVSPHKYLADSDCPGDENSTHCYLSENNPLYGILKGTGTFPASITVDKNNSK